MTNFKALAAPTFDQLTVHVDPPSTVRLVGSLALRDPAQAVGGFLRATHQAAVADKLPIVTVDVSKLSFVNSSSIRLFVDWIGWVRSEPADHRYKLRFLTTRHATWQRSTFSTLTLLAREVITSESVD